MTPWPRGSMHTASSPPSATSGCPRQAFRADTIDTDQEAWHALDRLIMDTPGDDPRPLEDDGFCVPGCPDDVCRMSGHCAWSANGPAPGLIIRSDAVLTDDQVTELRRRLEEAMTGRAGSVRAYECGTSEPA